MSSRHWIMRAIAVLAIGQAVALSAGEAAHVLALRLVGSPVTAVEAGDPIPIPDASTTKSETSGESPPDVTPVITGTIGEHAWYTSDVSLTWTVSDEQSPNVSKDGCDDHLVNADTKGDTFTCTATSDGGSRTTTVVIARDATAPGDVVATPSREPDHDGWYNHAFDVAWAGTDGTSGIGACTSTTYPNADVASPDTDAGTLNGACTDVAGNQSESLSFAFRYDGTAPVVTGTPDREPDHNGWYNHAVGITWDGGGATCDGPTSTYDGPDAEDGSATMHCVDQAGNETLGTFALKFDKTAPVITLVTPADGASYVLRQPVNAEYSCADDTSGVDACSGTVANGAAIDTGSVGGKSFTVSASDEAGNAAGDVTSRYSVLYAPAGTACSGVPGHQILEPISSDGSTTAKAGSTVPAKFRVCDWFGKPVTSAGVVTGFRIARIGTDDVDQPVSSTSAHDGWRSGDAQWIYNINTKGYRAGSWYGYEIALDDGTSVAFGFTTK